MAKIGRMKKRPSMRRPYTAARLAPARSSTRLILSSMEFCSGKRWSLKTETRYSSKFRFSPWLLFTSFRLNGLHPHPRCAHAQPEEPERRAAAQPARGHNRAFGLREKLARVRHAVRRGPAPLRGEPVGVRAAVPAAHGKAGRGSDRGALARDRHRAEGRQPQSALDGRDGHGNPRLPAASFRARRHAVLPRAWARAAGADRGANGG